MKASLAGISDAISWALHGVRERLRDVFVCSLAFEILNLAVLAPLAAAGFRLLMQRWGRASVGNFEIALFLLSPPGLAALVGIGSLIVATHFLEVAGLMRLLADRRLHWWSAFGSAAGLFYRIVQLGLRQVAVYLLLAVPFLAAIGIVYLSLWSGRDLNGLIILRPAEFWIGAGLGAAIAGIYVLLAARQFLRWLFAIPVLLFESSQSSRAALQRSTELTRGRLPVLAAAIASWGFIQVCSAGLVVALAKIVAEWILGRIGNSLTVALPVTAVLLLANAAVLMALSMFGWATFSALVLGLYRQAAGEVLIAREAILPEELPSRIPLRWVAVTGLVALCVGGLIVSGGLLGQLQLGEAVQITAHRAGALRGPENSVAAVRQAIADRADWAEIDVQRTADDKLVVMHDIDLARIGGGKRRVDQATLAEIQSLDIGSPFGPQFAGEKVPTFAEVLAAAGRELRLNVELKPHGRGDVGPLTERVVAAIQNAGLVDRCRICSQSYESLQRALELEPRLQVGFIAAVAVGDLARLDVDFLMVGADRAKRALIDRAALQEMEVHAWTVNSADQVAPLIDEGVANIITDDPVLIRQRLNEVQALSPVNRLLLRARHELMR
ncbi:glycerophosphodiester phosphodiesterase family protein [Caulifigura coniformis]|uniref:glycerophosphodiester phosphodiesterase family protein n=1 Tax=Caulifigura coniformis TaxID=2527983 RepID=UPI0018D25E26|nr:glycerophosphodiester phosphodiesterase family protein [Caulifigura coniformis]